MTGDALEKIPREPSLEVLERFLSSDVLKLARDDLVECSELRLAKSDALEKFPREQGSQNIERLLSSDVLNRYQAEMEMLACGFAECFQFALRCSGEVSSRAKLGGP